MNDEQSQQKIAGLEQTVQALTQRVWRLEQAVTELSVDARRATPPRPTATPAPAARLRRRRRPRPSRRPRR